MSKIVEFPKHKIVREAPANEGAIEQAKVKGKMKYADSIVDDIVDMVIEDLEQQGIDIDNESFLKDFSVTVDVLRSTIYRQFELDHPLHSFIDDNVTMIDRKTGKIVESSKDIDKED